MHGRQKFRSIHGGHAHVGNHHRIRPGASQFGQPFFRTHGQVSHELPINRTTQSLEHQGFVIHEENSGAFFIDLCLEVRTHFEWFLWDEVGHGDRRCTLRQPRG